MPITYGIVGRVIFVVAEGRVVDAEALEAQHAMFNDAAFDGTYPRLIDASGVTDWQVTAGMIKHCAISAYDRGLRRAAFVSNDSELVRIMLRLYSQYVGHAEVEIFRASKAAANWLTYRATLDAAAGYHWLGEEKKPYVSSKKK